VELERPVPACRGSEREGPAVSRGPHANAGNRPTRRCGTESAGVQITGNLTVHGVTKEVTFQGIATFNRNGTIAGRAKTIFNFGTFGLNKPTIARLMSVDDKITLELVYRLERS
jgi:polyisoprenoid-binding protein YceI